MRRLFIALDLVIPVVERLAAVQHELAEGLTEELGDAVSLRRTSAENIHLTLKFLGEQPAELEPLIIKTLERLSAPLFPFEVECCQIGAFPNAAKARILWAGLDRESTEVLSLLQRALERDLEELGVMREPRKFHPHVTLARVKTRQGPVDVTKILNRFETVSFGRSFIKDLVLFASSLHADGPRYEVVRRFSLGHQ